MRLDHRDALGARRRRYFVPGVGGLGMAAAHGLSDEIRNQYPVSRSFRRKMICTSAAAKKVAFAPWPYHRSIRSTVRKYIHVGICRERVVFRFSANSGTLTMLRCRPSLPSLRRRTAIERWARRSAPSADSVPTFSRRCPTSAGGFLGIAP